MQQNAQQSLQGHKVGLHDVHTANSTSWYYHLFPSEIPASLRGKIQDGSALVFPLFSEPAVDHCTKRDEVRKIREIIRNQQTSFPQFFNNQTLHPNVFVTASMMQFIVSMVLSPDENDHERISFCVSRAKSHTPVTAGSNDILTFHSKLFPYRK